MIFQAPYKIVLIDDDEDVVNLVKYWVNNHYGDRVHVSSYLTYNEGLKFVEGNETHIVICDIHLGDEHGEDIIARCEQLERGIKVIALSADMSLTTALECFSLGADFFIDKPISETQVCGVVDRCIDHFRYWHHIIQSRVQHHKEDRNNKKDEM